MHTLARRKLVTMDVIYFVSVLLATGDFTEGFTIRLWPLNTEGTEGLVEAFYNGSWGFVGSPDFRFTDTTATFLCKTLNLSEFGYGSDWMSMENYTGHSWLHGLECFGNETVIEECLGHYKLKYNEYTNQSSWRYRYGSRLYCVDSRIEGGCVQNTGIIHTAFFGQIYTICYDGFDMNAATVLCNHLQYNGAVTFTGEPPTIPSPYNRQLLCTGNESSLTKCNRSVDIIDCLYVVNVVCRDLRFTHLNEYTDEGVVELYYNGSWGLVGDDYDSYFDDVTATNFCRTFGFINGGFSTANHPLHTRYERKVWVPALYYVEPYIRSMLCHWAGTGIPSLRNSTHVTWLYCYDFNVTDIQLVNGTKSYEGKVMLEINGRWGSICTADTRGGAKQIEMVGNIVCRILGYEGVEEYPYSVGTDSEFFWMSQMSCVGNESDVTECGYEKGPYIVCPYRPNYLAVKCIDIDECLSNPCLNGGSCEDGDQHYTCLCHSNWGGVHCEIDINECIPDPCLNGGSCKDGDQNYTCLCLSNWRGINCEMELIDECKSTPCLNNGSCIDLTIGYECVCVAGFGGKICQIELIDECRFTPCINNGSCIDLTVGYECVCEPGFEGKICQNDINDCIPSPCRHGGSCEDRLNGYTCYCSGGYEGANCQTEVESNTSLIVILVSVSGGLLLIIALTGFCWFRFRRTHPNSKEDTPIEPQADMGKKTEQTPTAAEPGGYTNLYHSVKEEEEVYDEIKDREVDEYLTPVTKHGPKTDAYGYLIIENDESQTTAL